MQLTILLATRNRAESLRRVLRSYCGLTDPAPWKIVIADNGSSDATAEVVRSFAADLPLEYVFEPQPGKTKALNAALPAVTGELAILTDDDVLPRADWLQRYRRAASEHPACSVFAGPIVPGWPADPPPWIEQNVGILTGAFAVSNPGMSAGLVDDMGRVSGGNFAIRPALLAAFGFDPRIGPLAGASYAMGSETEFLVRVSAAGHKTWWVPDAVAEHIIRAEQMSKEWLLQRAARLGKGWPHQQREWKDAVQLLGMPRWLIRQVARRAAARVWYRHFGTEAQAFGAAFEYARALNMLTESRSLSRSNGKPD